MSAFRRMDDARRADEIGRVSSERQAVGLTIDRAHNSLVVRDGAASTTIPLALIVAVQTGGSRFRRASGMRVTYGQPAHVVAVTAQTRSGRRELRQLSIAINALATEARLVATLDAMTPLS